MITDDDLSSRERVLLITLGVGEIVFFVLMTAGIYAALVWRPGAYVMLIGFTGRVLNHIAEGALRYRIVMTRPWPKVAPLDDDDDW